MVQSTKKQCSIDGCESALYSRGRCLKHYRQYQRSGSFTPKKVRETCTIEGCSAKHKGRGYCQRHYQRWWKYGDPLKTNYYETPDLALKARTTEIGDCLIWTGSTVGVAGHGYLRVGDGRMLAHRFAWEQENGPIPEGCHLDHMCHQPKCVKVSHLRLATPSQNGANRKGASANSKSGVRNVYKHKDGWVVWVTKNRTRNYFGLYQYIQEAAEVAEQARRELFGEYAGRG